MPQQAQKEKTMQRLPMLADRIFAWAARLPIIVAIGVAFVVLNVIILSAVQSFEAVSAGLPILEVPSFAPASELGEIARAYPPEAAQIYRTVVQPLDVLFPLAAGVFFGSTIYLLAVTVAGRQSPWRALSLLGIGMVLTDYLENIGVFILLRAAENPPPGLEVVLRVVIVVKFAAGIITVICVLALLGILLVQRINRSFGMGRNRLER
jgi:hypothetical protein